MTIQPDSHLEARGRADSGTERRHRRGRIAWQRRRQATHRRGRTMALETANEPIVLLFESLHSALPRLERLLVEVDSADSSSADLFAKTAAIVGELRALPDYVGLSR